MNDSQGLQLGDEWWQQLLSYGLGRKWDSEYLLPYEVAQNMPWGTDYNGRAYPQGQYLPAPTAAISPVVMGIGALAVVGLIILAVKA